MKDDLMNISCSVTKKSSMLSTSGFYDLTYFHLKQTFEGHTVIFGGKVKTGKQMESDGEKFYLIEELNVP